jgi:hypothetical protein
MEEEGGESQMRALRRSGECGMRRRNLTEDIKSSSFRNDSSDSGGARRRIRHVEDEALDGGRKILQRAETAGGRKDVASLFGKGEADGVAGRSERGW